MMSRTLSRPWLFRRVFDLCKTPAPSRDDARVSEIAQHEARASRDAILEVLDRNPGAFRSEFDIQTLAHLYRCKY